MQQFIQQKKSYKKRLDFLTKNLDFIFEYFFIGFIIGNLFGSFLIFFRDWFIWDGLLIICLIFLLEIGNFLVFQSITRTQKFARFLPIRAGILIGFFVDAYKVGS
uniref:Hypothetical chloroplast RF20 n=1 Tax=Bryopsis plumosa TaxID=3130 RepID=A0A0D6E1Y5_BRYPL|nr:hypothetical chloroplast RF20 [Bryopsis plumosa]CEO90995.1 hypothetical chloroplast RF20 [Bryopsis plumosa]